mmetsp:Transcript_6594/g.21294  ORF Transcript_6594/g.21294 Transcript_6594/m.21294 type:complete len:217 (-) Transcript_6594:771-1421(-)
MPDCWRSNPGAAAARSSNVFATSSLASGSSCASSWPIMAYTSMPSMAISPLNALRSSSCWRRRASACWRSLRCMRQSTSSCPVLYTHCDTSISMVRLARTIKSVRRSSRWRFKERVKEPGIIVLSVSMIMFPSYGPKRWMSSRIGPASIPPELARMILGSRIAMTCSAELTICTLLNRKGSLRLAAMRRISSFMYSTMLSRAASSRLATEVTQMIG